ncbi:MAG: tRNA 2-thiouridine(34) synthase MnmA [Candidatus Delongbacteria bacterium]|nr:tRNA 2-thiouridine(34) synthase MnmA [Candidatus Delongbacteria bacterium]MCG2760796.1 tRNA 2-thiouridine(34) synthase MnmA [Candidatus Delongbacteria bacterium]
MKNKRVLVGMSGGVDSSVAAYLLKDQGYEVIGATMNLWSYEEYGGNNENEKCCCSIEIFNDARAIAAEIGIPHYVINFREEFKRVVIDNFIAEYMNGRTPNPCVICNTVIKWVELLKKADEMNCTYIATGHYATIRYNEPASLYELYRGKDTKKDQSYFLYGMTQKALSRTLFPIGYFTKEEVRAIAKKLGLKTAEKKESMEICFIPDNDYRRFLKENIEDFGRLIKPGKMLDSNGMYLKREHEGFPFYTIGQRKGLGGGFPEPMYVKSVDAKSNTISIGKESELYGMEVLVSELNWLSGKPDEKEKYSAKIRFNSKDKQCNLKFINDNIVKIIFDEPVFAVTPGQSCVIYKDDMVIGGGVITE